MVDDRVRELIFDIDRPHPDVALDTIRRYVRQTLGAAADQLLALLALQQLSNTYLTALKESRDDRAGLRGKVAALEGEVAQLKARLDALPTTTISGGQQ